MKKKSQSIALYGILIALGLLFSYIERMIPIPIPIPGVKLGLANLITVIGLYTIGIKGTIVVSLVRIIVVGFTFSNLFSMIYGTGGWLLSITAMILCLHCMGISCIGVSVIGGIFHNVGQIVIAIWVTQTPEVITYLPFLLISGVVAGSVIGMLGGNIVVRLKKGIQV